MLFYLQAEVPIKRFLKNVSFGPKSIQFITAHVMFTIVCVSEYLWDTSEMKIEGIIDLIYLSERISSTTYY